MVKHCHLIYFLSDYISYEVCVITLEKIIIVGVEMIVTLFVAWFKDQWTLLAGNPKLTCDLMRCSVIFWDILLAAKFGMFHSEDNFYYSTFIDMWTKQELSCKNRGKCVCL